MTAATKATLVEDLGKISGLLNEAEYTVEELRINRNRLFVIAYDARAISVTEMARISGLRRDSVHDAIRRTKGDRDE